MPEKGWVALTVRESIGSRIKESARNDGLTVSEYLEWVILGENAVKNAAKGTAGKAEEWTVRGLCEVQLKTRSLAEHMSRMHKKLWRPGAVRADPRG